MFETDKFIVTVQDPSDKPCSMKVHVPRRVRNTFDELACKTHIPRDDLAGMALQFALDRMEVQEEH